MRKAAWAAIIVGLLVFATVGFNLYLRGIAQDNLSNDGFSRIHTTTPWSLGLPHENVTIPVDGIELAGWWIPGGNDTVILVHGHSGNMSRSLHRWAEHVHGLGYNVLAMDLRNHGASPDLGQVSYGAAESRDVLAAAGWVRERTSGGIALYGASMGAATVLEAAATGPDRVVAVLADSAYASFAHAAHVDGKKDGFPPLVIDWVLWHMGRADGGDPRTVDGVEALTGLPLPVFLAHCSDDRRVDPAGFSLLEAAALAPVTWYGECPRQSSLSETHHVEGWMQPGYNATVAAFLEDAFSDVAA